MFRNTSQDNDALKKSINAFEEKVKNTFIFPGSLYELNENPRVVNGWHYGYRTMPGAPHVKGVIIPSLKEIYEIAAVRDYSFAQLLSSVGGEIGDGIAKEFDEMFECLTPITQQLFANEALLAMDLRSKAKALGADGVVRVQLYTMEPAVTHWGVPVIKKSPDRRDRR